MTYKDKTFCTFWEECKYGVICHRALTLEERKEAKLWWGNEDVPISVFLNKPNCFIPNDGKTVQEETTSV